MTITLNTGELEELKKQAPNTAQDGGFQSFLVKLQGRVDPTTGELDLADDDLKRIQRYAFGYKNGGWQTRLMNIFGRNLGTNLNST